MEQKYATFFINEIDVGYTVDHGLFLKWILIIQLSPLLGQHKRSA